MVRKHAFVSFTDRVASIRIDPIRRSEKKRNAPDAANSESLFMSSLERWNELNLASHYTNFSNKCSPLVQSLPMLLHNQSRVFMMLVEAVKDTDEHSVEPLLDLLVQFARDLGEDFEQFYPRALETCIDVIQRFQKQDSTLEVVEMAFNCLAHVFKYLSRLLTTNLIPTYDYLVPLFGGTKGSKQRSFVLRFAAESMAFLVRRTKDESLTKIVDHIVQGVANDPTNSQYTSSSAQLLASTLKGPQTMLHSKAPLLLAEYYRSCHKMGAIDLYCHIITEALHHVRQDTAKPIYEATLSAAAESQDEFAARSVFVLAGLRKGDRVSDWESIYKVLIVLAPNCGTALSWTQAACATICYANVFATTKHLKELLQAVPKLEVLVRIMLIVSTTSVEVMKTYKAQFWTAVLEQAQADNEEHLKLLALICADVGFVEENPQVSREFNKLITSDIISRIKAGDSISSSSLFSMWWRALLCKNNESIDESKYYSKLIRAKLSADSDDSATKAFQSLVLAQLLTDALQVDADQISQFPLHPQLLDSISDAIQRSPDAVEKQTLLNTLSPKMLPYLLSCDPRIRGSVLRLYKLLVKPKDDMNFLLDQCAVINDLPHDLENARNISHRLRSLATKYKLTGENSDVDKLLCQVTLHFIFGMLTTRLQPVWLAVLELMPKLSEKNPKEVCRLAMHLIGNPGATFASDLIIGGSDNEGDEMEVEPEAARVYETLDCHTLSTLQTLSEQAWNDSVSVTASLESRAVATLQFEHHEDVRSLGIRALSEIPSIAERLVGSLLVPFLLQAEDDEHDSDDHDDKGHSSVSIRDASFTFKDKLVLLELFSKFRHSEKLPNFPEVRARYLYFLASRHAPLQRLGFKCLLTIESPDTKVLRKYRANFDAMLDDKRFRDELMSFICASEDDQDEGSLHPDDKSVVMPYVVRLLYGRAQNSTKRNMRYAVLASLHSLDPQYITMFVELAHGHLIAAHIIGDDVDFSDRTVSRKIQGYLSLMSDFVNHLKTATKPCIPLIVRQGLFPILEKLDLQEHKTLRQLVTKDIEDLMSSVPLIEVWEPLYPTIYEKLVQPQLAEFSQKNHENVSNLMKLILAISNEIRLIKLIDEDTVVALSSCIADSSAKDSVITLVLKLVINLATMLPESAVTQAAVAHVVRYLPAQMEKELSVDCFATAVDAINKIFSLGVDHFPQEVVHNIALVSFGALDKPSRLIPLPVKGSLLHALSQILDHTQCSLDLIHMAYDKLAPLFRQFVSRDHRLHLSACYEVFGRRAPQYARVGKLIVELNSFDDQRLGEPDFNRRSVAFEDINEFLYKEFTVTEWKPIMFNLLFFMRDPEELVLRNSGKFSIMRLIESRNAPELVRDFVLPAIKKGLRDTDEKFRRLYVDLLGQCAHFDVMPTLNILLYKGDEEADFFINVNHVQVHRRRRALQRLGKHATDLDPTVIAHYMLSIVENFAILSGSKNGDVNNLADDALHAMTELLKHVSEGQYKSVARRCTQNVLQNPEPAKLRKQARIITAVAQAAPRGIDDFLIHALISPLHKFLSAKANEHENLPDRVPLAVAIAYFMKSLNEETLEVQLPGKLTSLCQLLRSKIPEMRDTVRQSLGRIARIFGAKYLKFIVSELYGALRKGGLQSHILGFTAHSILVELARKGQSSELQVGDFDDSAGIIFRIVINDTFGSIGEEKDSENYVTTAKEVKQHTSYDTAEILATWTSLSQFGRIVEPMRDYLCSTKLSSKAEHKVEEVLRRLAAGLHKNPQAGIQDSVVMGYEIFALCDRIIEKRNNMVSDNQTRKEISGSLAAREEAARESEKFFTVRLSSRDWYDGAGLTGRAAHDFNSTRYAPTNLHLLQTFALETLRSVMTNTSGGATTDAGKGLLTVANVKGLVPIVVKGLESSYEDLNIAALRLATTTFRLPVPFAESDNTLEVCGQRTLHFIESCPSTNSLLCQTALKFLTLLVRSKPEFELKAGAVAYVLERMRPDLEEPERQGTAIAFIRAIFARKAMLPQVYDVADTISKVLVTNQSDHIRVNCRAAYLHFLTTYPLGKTRLDRHLAALGANLRYATAAGRLSVMEMIYSLLQKIQAEQLESAFIQYFASLALISATDTEPECRKRSLELIRELVDKTTSSSIRDQMIDYCSQWLGSLGKNDLLVRGGLEVAPMLVGKPGSEKLGKQLRNVIAQILRSGQRAAKAGIEWQLVYLALDQDVTAVIDLVEGVLLFPHPWVRARAARDFGQYFKNTPKEQLDLDLLIRVGYKMARQLGAPRLNETDSLQIVKNLVFILPIWEANHASMEIIRKAKSENKDGAEANEKQPENCVDWLAQKLGSTIRTDASAPDFVGSKTGAVQILAAMPSILPSEAYQRLAYDAILSLFILNDQLTAEDAHLELRDLAQEAMSIYDQALGTTEYLKLYTKAQKFVQDRRRDRRAKRSIEAVTDPESYAMKKMKRNAHKHEVRKSKNQKAH